MLSTESSLNRSVECVSMSCRDGSTRNSDGWSEDRSRLEYCRRRCKRSNASQRRHCAWITRTFAAPRIRRMALRLRARLVVVKVQRGQVEAVDEVDAYGSVWSAVSDEQSTLRSHAHHDERLGGWTITL